MRLTKGTIIAAVAVVAVLAAAFWYGGSAPGLQGWSAAGTTPPVSTPPAVETSAPSAAGALAPAATETVLPAASTAPAGTTAPTEPPAETAPAPTPSAAPLPTPDAVTSASVVYSQEHGMEIDPETGKDKYLTEPVPEGKPLPMEPQDAVITDVARTCTLSVSCATILDHMDWLDQEKAELVPEDGVIFPATEVTFYEGESVFNLLQREMKRAKIHMEFEDTPIYNSAYIEAINNLYEFDCGEQSGWMYSVNGWFPNYGCSRYALQEGDTVEWVYTCDLGKDVGNTWSVGG